MAKISREKFKTEKTVFDQFTVRTLRKLESEGFLEFEALTPLSMGKEANVFLTPRNDGIAAVKIYRLETCDFNKMYEYMVLDERFQQVKRKKRDIILLWVQREYRNLLKAREGKVSVPTPLAVKQNVLVMEVVGDPAEKLQKDPPQDPEAFYDLLLKEVKKFYEAGLVHADLSAFNILNDNQKPVLIDVSQSLSISSHAAKRLLERDLKNVNTFFEKLGVKALKTREDFLAE